MAKNPMMKLLSAPDKGISQTHGPNGILARLFRTILYDEDITPFRYMDLMDAFIREGQSGVPVNRVDLTSWRGNLTKELGKEQMSWKVFCKALRFLQIIKIEFQITAYWKKGKVTKHATWVDFGSKEALNELNKPEDDSSSDDNAQYKLPLDYHGDDEYS
jgi:hypothetical protein